MTQETRAIAIPVYRDSDGKPVCGKCIFLGSNGMGYPLCCASAVQIGTSKYELFSLENARPHSKCPLWQGEEQ